jgi:phosphate transport system substrate-binding protein
MVFRECIATWASVTTDCTPVNTRILGVADGTGSGSTYFPIHAYANEKLKNGLGIPIPCDGQHACAVVGFSNYHNVYQADISFAPSPFACPPIGPSVVGGSGSAAATRAMFRWIAAVCEPPQSLQATYVTSNEHAAYDDLSKGLTEFGVTGLGPYPPKGVSGGPSYKLAPLTASAVVIAYRAYDLNGSQITDLTLTPDLIAQLFMGELNDFLVNRAISALNPGIMFPTRTQVVVRAEFNTETYMLTSWLKAVAPSVWKPPTSPSPDIFPATGIDLKFGERAAALDIVDPPQGFDPSVVYIGAVDSSTAAFYGLPTVKIRMPDGSTLSANSESILKAIGDMALLPDGTLLPQWANYADQAAWPLPNITYMLAPTNTIDPQRGKTVATFLRYAVQDGQKLVTGDDGYVPLPATLVANSLAVADKIPEPPPPSPSPTPAPSPSLPPALALPPLPSPEPAGVGTAGGMLPSSCSSGCTGGRAASNARIATLSYSQGQELAAAARQQSGLPPQYVLPLMLVLAGLLIVVGVGLQIWSRRQPTALNQK